MVAISLTDAEAEGGCFSYLRALWADRGVASVGPSSKYVIDKVLDSLDPTGDKLLLEYGAADGPVTRRVLERLPADGKLVAVERNETFFASLVELASDRRLHPVRGDVREVSALARRHGIGRGQADAIISGIPFSCLSAPDRRELLAASAELLRPGGRFIAYQMTLHLVPLLKDYFSRIETRFELRNLPPLFVFTAYK